MNSVKKQLAQYQLHRLELLHRNSENPTAAWEAFLFARRAGVDVPNWVMAYLDNCAHGIVAGNPPGEALGLTMEKGEHSKQSRLTGESDNLALAQSAQILRDMDSKTTWNKIYEQVAIHYGCSWRTVKRASLNYRSKLTS